MRVWAQHTAQTEEAGCPPAFSVSGLRPACSPAPGLLRIRSLQKHPASPAADGGALTGPIPRELITCFPEIDEIDLSYSQARCGRVHSGHHARVLGCCRLRYAMPCCIVQLRRHIAIVTRCSCALSPQQITGTIPAFLGTLTKLEELKVRAGPGNY